MPGTPDIPKEAIVFASITMNTIGQVILWCIILRDMTTNMAGNIPAQACMPRVAPILGTKSEYPLTIFFKQLNLKTPN